MGVLADHHIVVTRLSQGGKGGVQLGQIFHCCIWLDVLIPFQNSQTHAVCYRHHRAIEITVVAGMSRALLG